MRLDNYIKENFNVSRSRALDLIKLGSVKVNNEINIKPSYQVKEGDVVDIIEMFKYASRAGEKLEDAIISFNLDFKDKIVLDVGSSTGGFTDCSLSFNAKRVYAYDVGVEQMIDKLKYDKRVILKEGTNILSITPEIVDICLVDVSFTSIKPIITYLKDNAKLYILLFKPQFEVGPKHLKKGIVKDIKIVKKSLDEFKDFLKELSLNVVNYKPVLKGKKGNQEYIFVCERS